MAKFIPKAQSFKNKIDRAVHNLSCNKSTTLHPLTAVPLYYRRMFKGDSFTFGVAESAIMSEPTFAPLLGSWRLRFEWYFDSDSNRYGWMDNNTRLSANDVMNRRHHSFITDRIVTGNETFFYEDTIGRGGVCDYAGIAPTYAFVDNTGSDPDAPSPDGAFGTEFNIDFHLTYLNIIRNYHVNKQFPRIPYIVNSDSSSIVFDDYPLELMDELFIALRSAPNGVKFNIPRGDTSMPSELDNYYNNSLVKFLDYLSSCQSAHGGLFCTQFEPDIYQNLMSQSPDLLKSTINVQDGGFTIEEFRLRNHLQGLYDKIFVSGGTDRDLSRTLWGIESNEDYDIPELLCVHSEIIGTNLITSTTAGEATDVADTKYANVPGSLSGNINARRGKGRFQKFTAKQSGSLMCIVTLTPLCDYSENIERHLLEHNFMDEFTPDMARKGFENVPRSDYNSLPYQVGDLGNNGLPSRYTYIAPLDQSIGKNIAWLREMSAVNRVHGELSNLGDKRDWVLKRSFLNFTSDGFTNSFTPYGNPLGYQYPFVSQTINDPNFTLEVAFYNRAYRPIPRRFMPNLGY